MWTFSFIFVSFLTARATGATGSDGESCPALTCNKDYQALKDHTLCLTDKRNVTIKAITNDTRQYILDRHNEIRRGVNPVATDLYELTWDQDLATLADKWARQCKKTSDTNRKIIGSGLFIEQNMASKGNSWMDVINRWFKQQKSFVYGQGPKKKGKSVDSYTLIVSKDAYYIGCGYAECNNKNYYVCNYGLGRRQHSLTNPYTQGGTRCSACINCKNGLCAPVYRLSCQIPSCDDGYSSTHTICRPDHPKAKNPGVSEQEQKQILDMHNTFRRDVTPKARNLSLLYWDPKLAFVAQEWANLCINNHDKNFDRAIDTYGMFIGQNLAYGYRTWEIAIKAWHDEVDFFGYGKGPVVFNKPVGHYTQIVHEAAQRVGCGFAECPFSDTLFTRRHYACNYAHGQNSIAIPYTKGTPCDGCPDNCNNGLCDCNGKVCYNEGTLDVATCSCKCRRSFVGPSCEKLICPSVDHWTCGRWWHPEHCTTKSNVPVDCLIMCGRCPK